MQGLSTLVLGLGLFFLGVQLIGENLRRLSSPSFGRAIRRVSERPVLAGLTGLGFGALMESATAVVFILAGMTRSGLVSARGAAPVILWCNVGLTALAFLATLNIHPYVAYFAGAAGIFFGTARQPRWRAAAGVALGVGLVLFGLESMGDGASPLRNATWFQSLLSATVNSPAIAFAAGILAAALLQSNTGAAMLVITLAGVGSLSLAQAALLLYGTNLGAIALRFFLSLNLDAPSRRLVRLEDLFCVWSGVLMCALFFVEQAGVPLVLAGATHIFPADEKLQLALVFLLSNLVPAVLMSPALGVVLRQLEKWLPGAPAAALARPRYISDTALDDPDSALDLMTHEIARLLGAVAVKPERAQIGEDGDPVGDPAFGQLNAAIERFGAKLAAKRGLTHAHAHALHLLRAELALVRYIDEVVREFNGTLAAAQPDPAAQLLADGLSSLLAEAAGDAKSLDSAAIANLRARTKRHGDFVKAQTAAAKAESRASDIPALADAFETAAWMLHRLSKVLGQLAAERPEAEKSTH
jgi:phosphate:Na+ symporter